MILSVKVAPCQISAPLGESVWLDLASQPEAAARKRLLRAVLREEAISSSGSVAEADAPRFPGAWPRTWWLPINRYHGLVGRDALLATLRARLHAGQPLVLHGPAGVGKTQLAVEYAYRYGADYDLVWWLRATGPAVLAQESIDLLDRLSLDVLDRRQIVARVRSELERSAREGWRRWLLILDDAPGPADWLRAAIPAGFGGRGQVLITSSCPEWGAVAQGQPVAAWGEMEAVAFLRGQTGLDDPAGACELARALGNLPLTLSLAAACIRASGVSYVAYAALIGQVEDGREMLPAVWRVTQEQLSQTPGAAELAQLSALLAPEAQPLEALLVGAPALPESLAAQAREPDRWVAARDALQRYAVWRGRASEWAMHAALQRAARQALTPEERAAWASRAVSAILAEYPKNPQADVDSWPACGELLPHGLAAAGYAEKEGALSGDLGGLLNTMGMYVRHGLVDPVGARELFQRALHAVEAAHGPDHPYVGAVLNNLATIRQDLGDLPGAREALERALRIVEIAQGPEHPDLAILLKNLAGVLRAQGDLSAARAVYQRALGLLTTALGPDHPTTCEVQALLSELG